MTVSPPDPPGLLLGQDQCMNMAMVMSVIIGMKGRTALVKGILSTINTIQVSIINNQSVM